MVSTVIVSLAVMAGIAGLIGVPLRCRQFYTGRFHSQIPQHALARATFGLFAALILLPNLLAWVYAVYVAYRDYTDADAQLGVASAVAVGLLGCAYVLLEGFLLTARRRTGLPVGGGTTCNQPGNALLNSAAKRE